MCISSGREEGRRWIAAQDGGLLRSGRVVCVTCEEEGRRWAALSGSSAWGGLAGVMLCEQGMGWLAERVCVQ